MDLLEEPEWKADESRGRAFANPKLNAVALPLAFGLAWVLNFVGLGLISLLFYHEFGHAFAAWLCGRWAFAIPIAGITFIGQERSWFVTALVLGGLGWLWNRARRENLYGLFALSTALLLLSADLMFVAGKGDCDAAILWAGSGGELILATLVILAFYYRVADGLRWDFWRWPLLLTAACSFLFASQTWSRAQEDPAKLVLGGASTGSSRDKDADWVRLVNAHGWNPEQVVDRYEKTAQACLAAIALHYAVFLLLPARKPREDDLGS
jgi:hypothetical protein